MKGLSGPMCTLSVLFLIGVFFPTSMYGSISATFLRAAFVISCSVMAYLVWKLGYDQEMLLGCALPMAILLSIFTLTSGLPHIDIGPLLTFLAVGLMYCLRLKKFPIGNYRRILNIFSIANIVLGFGVILGWGGLNNFLISWYSNWLDNMMSAMVDAHMPAFTYTAHHIAAMFIYFFFWMNLKTFKESGYKFYLWMAIIHVFLCAAIQSHTSFVFAAIAFAELLWMLWEYSRKLALASVIAVVFIVPWLLLNFTKDLVSWSDAAQFSYVMWTGDDTAFIGRYGINGNMHDAIVFLEEHPFRPIGSSYGTNTLMLVDSGPLEYMLRGSVLLIILMYGGLWYFLRRNLLSYRDCCRFFAIIIATEMGFGVMTYIRTFCLFPAFVIYLNSQSAPLYEPKFNHAY